MSARLLAGCGLVFVALVTMAFVAAGPDEPVTSDVVAGSGDPAPDLVEAELPTAEPTATPGPEADAAAVEPAAGSDEELVDTDAAAPEAVVPEDFVPVFVAEDLTDTGAHTSATPAPAAPQPSAPAAPEPRPTSTPAPSPPQADPEPPATVVPTPQPPTPQAMPDTPESPGDGPTAAGWAALRDCESSGNYGIDTGNGYYGAYQFSQATWDWIAGMVRPDLVGVVPSDASPGDQDALAFALYDLRGAAPWPTCGAYLR